MDQKTNLEMAESSYTTTNPSNLKNALLDLRILAICNYTSLIANILTIVAPLVWCVVYYTRDIPVNSVGMPLYDMMTPIDLFLNLYYIRLALALVIFVISIIILIQTSRKSKQAPLAPFFEANYQETINMAKSNIVVSSLIVGECLLLIICAALLVGTAFGLGGGVGAIIAGVIMVVLVSTEYVKIIGACRQQSKRKQL